MPLKRCRYRSSVTSVIRSLTSSTNVMSFSKSPATPSPSSMRLQKVWVVAMVAASNSATALQESATRRPTSSSSCPRDRGQRVIRPLAAVRVCQRGGESGEPLPRAFPKFGGGEPTEGDQQEVRSQRTPSATYRVARPTMA